MYRMLRAGADKVSVNSAAIARPEMLARGRAALRQPMHCARYRRAPPPRRRLGGLSHGGRRATGLDVLAWARRGVELGAGELLLTSMDADGTARATIWS